MHENYFSSIFFFTISILMDFRYFVTLRFYGTIFESGGSILDWNPSIQNTYEIRKEDPSFYVRLFILCDV